MANPDPKAKRPKEPNTWFISPLRRRLTKEEIRRGWKSIERGKRYG